MRCAIYARVSTEGQRERDTIASQLSTLPKYAAAQGWKVVDQYVDDGVSGETIEERPEFRRLLKDMKAGKIGVVLAVDYDRITRSQSDEIRGRISDTFRATKVLFASPTTGVRDFGDETLRIVMGVEGSMSASEKSKFLRRSARGKREKARKGHYHFAVDVYGYQWDATNKLYVINPTEAAAIKRAYELAIEHGISMVGWHLDQEGYKPRKEGKWANTTVCRMLRNKLYKGEWDVFKNKDQVTMAMPVIIPAEQWQRVQDVRSKRQASRKTKWDREYLLAGMARCGVCGRLMWCNPSDSSGTHNHNYYRCQTSNQWRGLGMDGACGNRGHRIDHVDAAVWNKVIEVLRDPKLLAEACALADRPKGVDWGKQAEGAERTLARLTRVERDVLARNRRGQLSSDALDHELGEIARERDLAKRNLKLAQQQLSDAAAKTQMLADLSARAKALGASVSKATFEQRRALLRLIVPVEYGCRVILHADRRIEIMGAIPGELGEEMMSASR